MFLCVTHTVYIPYLQNELGKFCTVFISTFAFRFTRFKGVEEALEGLKK